MPTSTSVITSFLTGQTPSTRQSLVTSDLRMIRETSRSLTSLPTPFLLTGELMVLLMQSRTRDDAAHAGPSLLLEPWRPPTLLHLEKILSKDSLCSSSLTVLALNMASRVATVATSLLPSNTLRNLANLPCLRVIILTPQVCMVMTQPTAFTRPPEPPKSKLQAIIMSHLTAFRR